MPVVAAAREQTCNDSLRLVQSSVSTQLVVRSSVEAMQLIDHSYAAEFADTYNAVKESNSLKVNWNEEWKADSNQ